MLWFIFHYCHTDQTETLAHIQKQDTKNKFQQENIGAIVKKKGDRLSAGTANWRNYQV